jgi:hypothetical protein
VSTRHTLIGHRLLEVLRRRLVAATPIRANHRGDHLVVQQHTIDRVVVLVVAATRIKATARLRNARSSQHARHRHAGRNIERGHRLAHQHGQMRPVRGRRGRGGGDDKAADAHNEGGGARAIPDGGGGAEQRLAAVDLESPRRDGVLAMQLEPASTTR